jgi:hypothetical protein
MSRRVKHQKLSINSYRGRNTSQFIWLYAVLGIAAAAAAYYIITRYVL